MHVLGISGSLRRESYNRRLLELAARGLPPGAKWETWEGLARVPAFSEDLERGPAPLAVADLRAALHRADAVLFATPEYNHSVPGQLKNALDWASRPVSRNPLRGKPAAVIGASTGLFGAVWAQAELRKVLQAIGARVVDDELPVASAHQAFASDGSLGDPDLQRRLDGIVHRLVEASAADRQAA